MTKKLIIFDFDWSLADEDTDHQILKLLEEKLEPYSESQAWIDYVACQYKILHNSGYRRKDFIDAFHDFPISPHMVEAIRLAKDSGADIFIVSDGNSLLLNIALEKYGLSDCFKKIITNETTEDANGLFTIKPVFERGSHDCKTSAAKVGLTCSYNLCKGKKVSEIKSGFKYLKTIYIGDGKNDFCAACHLDKNDLVMVRRGRSLENIIASDSDQISAEIKKWNDACEVLDQFKLEFE